MHWIKQWAKNIVTPHVFTIQRSFLLFHFAVWHSKRWRPHCVDSCACNCCRQWPCGNTGALMLFQIRRWRASLAQSSPEATSWSTMRQSTPSAEREFTHACVFPRSWRRYFITQVYLLYESWTQLPSFSSFISICLLPFHSVYSS